MSVSLLGYLSRSLNRFLKVILTSIRGLPPYRLISRLFTFLSSLHRWTCTGSRQPTLPESSTSSISSNDGVVCAMNVPSLGPHDADDRNRPSHVDPRYTSARSPSGHHLMPYSPTPARRHTRDDIPWITTGSQISLHDEPSSTGHNTSQATSDSTSRPTASVITDAVGGTYTWNVDTLAHSSRPLSPLHETIDLTLEPSPSNSGVQVLPHANQTHFNTDQSEPPRSRTPLSVKSSSQLSGSQKSHTSQSSIGRASYREYRDPIARVRTPGSRRNTPSPNSGRSASVAPGHTRGPVDSAVPLGIIAPPRGDSRKQPGEPVHVGDRLLPVSVHSLLRYDNRAIRSPSAPDDYKIDAMMYQYPEALEEVPDGWVACRHPGGVLYFVHSESKTFTEVNICDKDIYEDVEGFRTSLFLKLKIQIREQNLYDTLNVNEIQLVLEPQRDEQEVVCCYYFVNPRTRSLFWLHEWEGYEIFADCIGTLSSPHKGLGIQAHYWFVTWHWDFFPNFCEVTPELKNEVVDVILLATCGQLTSDASTCPLNPKELNNYISLIERINPENARERGHCAIIIGRIMHIFYHYYFLNFHGEECARLTFDQTVYGWRYHPSLLMSIFAPLLFMAPVNNVRLLHRISVDSIVNKEKWNMFVTKLNSQLQATSVLATVLLNANVAFLPKPSGRGTSPEQFLTYMSLVASMASIILGLVFMGHGHAETRKTPVEAAKFLDGLRNEERGLETLAIIYSLPYAFLMWGMLLFFAAFAVQWCYPSDTVSRACACAFMFIAALVVAWCIWTAGDRCNFWWFQPDPNQVEHEKEADDENRKAFSSILQARLNPLREFTRSLIRKLMMPTSVPDESHVMRDAPSIRGALDP